MPRVVPPLPRSGLLALSAAAGLLSSIAADVLGKYAQSVPSKAGRSEVLLTLLRLSPFLGPGIAYVLLLSLATPRRSDVLKATAAFSLTFALGVNAMEVLLNPWFTMPLQDQCAPWLITPALITLLYSGLALAVHWGISKTVLAPIEQTGSLCWRCGYDAGDFKRCPECGREREQRTPFAWRRLLNAAAARARTILGLLLVVLLTLACYRVWTYTMPAWRFQTCMKGAEQIVGWLGTGSPISATGRVPALGVSVPFTAGASAGVAMSYSPSDVPKRPAMQVFVYETRSNTAGRFFNPYNPPIWCDLDRAQAEYVTRHGLPAALVDEFKRQYEIAQIVKNGGGRPDQVRIGGANFFPASAPH